MAAMRTNWNCRKAREMRGLRQKKASEAEVEVEKKLEENRC